VSEGAGGLFKLGWGVDEPVALGFMARQTAELEGRLRLVQLGHVHPGWGNPPSWAMPRRRACMGGILLVGAG
jgi:hypothetical protein